MLNNVELLLNNKEWKEFLINEIFIVENSKAYHKTNLKEIKTKGIPYISRTNNNNGLAAIVQSGNYKENESNTIVFGAENVTFFFQPFKYITGNKIYTIKSDKINKYSGQFIQNLLNISIKNCGFGYGKLPQRALSASKLCLRLHI